MQRTTTLLLATAAIAAAFGTTTAAPLDDAGLPMATGEHFTLNLIGKEKIGNGGFAGGSRIFVPLEGDCRINLSEGDFGVTDGNCVADGVAGFTLPNPDPENDGVSSYRVYVRALAKPGGTASLTTCKEDANGDTWCSTESVVVMRAGGHSPSYEVSRETLTVCADQDGDGTYEREQIFDDENAGYYWEYANQGLRLAQLRFYPNTPTDISGPCPAA